MRGHRAIGQDDHRNYPDADMPAPSPRFTLQDWLPATERFRERQAVELGVAETRYLNWMPGQCGFDRKSAKHRAAAMGRIGGQAAILSINALIFAALPYNAA
jgi:hypothetical protein